MHKKPQNNKKDQINKTESIEAERNKKRFKLVAPYEITIFFNRIYFFLFNYMRSLGIHSQKYSRRFRKKSRIIYKRYFAFYVGAGKFLLKKAFWNIAKVILFIWHKTYAFLHFFVDAKNVVQCGFNKKKNKSFFIRLNYATRAFFAGVRNNTKVFKTALNYSLPIISIIGFVFVVNYVFSLNFAVSVEYNGQNLGFVESEKVFDQAEAKLQERMIYLDDEEAINNIPRFAVAVVDVKTGVKDDNELTDSIIQSSSKDIIQATGVSIDGAFYGAVKDKQKLELLLSNKLDKYKTGKAGETVHFTKDIKLETGFFVAKNITDEQTLFEKLDSQEQKDAFYTVESGDTPIMIAAKNDMSLDELQALNKDILTKCFIGQNVLINKSESFLPVSVSSVEEYTASIPFETKVTQSSKYSKGYSVTTQNGGKGEQLVTAKIERVDGFEISREILDSKIVKEPVTKLVTEGTAVYYEDTAPYSGSVSSGGFSWPVSGSYVSSPYGYRGRSLHTGIDCAFRGNGYGTPIRAAKAGKVISAGWGGSYGNLVKIDHGGGEQTWYAHASSINVRVGQVVGQGETIARVGSTGRSTGNHLHFEIRYGGSTANPRKYLP